MKLSERPQPLVVITPAEIAQAGFIVADVVDPAIHFATLSFCRKKEVVPRNKKPPSRFE